jgi:ketosteroid isomerase-like protein
MNDQDVRNIEAVRRMYAGEEGEFSVISPDIIWHVPGHNPVSGEYRGHEEYTQLMPARMAPLDRWDFDLDQVMVNGNLVSTTFGLKGERRGRRVELRGAHVIRLNEKGQVVEGWGFTNDQDALDEFFAA